MSIKYTDYACMETGQYQSVGKFGDEIYAYEMLTGITDTPEYKKMYETLACPVLCSDYLGQVYLDTSFLRDI